MPGLLKGKQGIHACRSSLSEPPLADLSGSWAARSAHRRIRSMVSDHENRIAPSVEALDERVERVA